MPPDEAPNRPAPSPAVEGGERLVGGPRAARPIAELIVQPEFPKSALGEWVDIGGYTGEVVDIVNQSLKVRSVEGVTKSFNAGGLRKLYGPRVIPDLPAGPQPSKPAPRPERVPDEKAEELPVPPKREVVVQPDFTKPVKNIAAYVALPDYPKCLLGEHIEIAGYSGVVVEIVNRSLKVRSQAETTRSYNADALRKLHGS